MDNKDRDSLLKEFLKIYPLERLSTFTLEECREFCSYVASRDTDLGRINIRNHLKFSDEDFQTIKDLINKTALYSNEGLFQKIDSLYHKFFPNTFKWKVASLYSNKKLPIIYAPDSLALLINDLGKSDTNNRIVDDKTKQSVLYETLLKYKTENEDIFKFSVRMWERIEFRKSIIHALQSEIDKSQLMQTNKTDDKEREFIWIDVLDNKKQIKVPAIKKCHFEFYLGKDRIGCDLHVSDSYYESLYNKGFNNTNPYFFNYPKEKSINYALIPYLDKDPISVARDAVKKMEEFINKIEEDLIDMKVTNSKSDYVSEYQTLLEINHNIILHGAPGTGKTYLAQEIAKNMDAEMEIVQFHPSYDYTDFVEGLRPCNKEEEVGFERVDGIFKKFCAKALRELMYSKIGHSSIEKSYKSFISNLNEDQIIEVPLHEDNTNNNLTFGVRLNKNENLALYTGQEKEKRIKAQGSITYARLESEYMGISKDPYWKCYYKGMLNYLEKNYGLQKFNSHELKNNKEIKKFVFIIDEINRGELSKIFGELFLAIDPDYRVTKQTLDNIEKTKPLYLKTQYSNMMEGPNEFDNAIKADTGDYGHFFVPENVYIIGTMNDIDRSVDAMDFAFRRRFLFKRIKAKASTHIIDKLDKLDNDIKIKAKNRMENLNNLICSGEIEGLSEDYEIGGAYFKKLVNFNGDFNKLWDYHLENVLKEYLRGIDDADEYLEKLKKAFENESSGKKDE